ncbi:MAG TPA: arsenic resistance protein [Leptolyngbyaceae cyanobacterium M65_K2018_010]|nr:arsenic resistance protein [Leptolyngbyaceae cyanobacterium M65_K2018_010]
MTKLTLERYQIWLYLLALAVGAGWGWHNPQAARGLEAGIAIALSLLLYTTFCQVPLTHLRQAFGHRRFMAALVVGNFALVPLVVWVLATLLLSDPKLQFGVFLVLLVPCTDWFLTFTYLGRGNLPLAIAATPLLLLLQSLLLPLYLWLFTNGQLAADIDPAIFVDALVGLILLPLGAALITEKWADSDRKGEAWLKFIAWLPIPSLSLVLLLISASQVNALLGQPLAPLGRVILIFGAFLVINGYLARWLGQRLGLDTATKRTLAFSLGTRNSFVVLPFALALPETWSVVVTIVVLQPLVELTGMLAYLWWIPQHLLPGADP